MWQQPQALALPAASSSQRSHMPEACSFCSRWNSSFMGGRSLARCSQQSEIRSAKALGQRLLIGCR